MRETKSLGQKDKLDKFYTKKEIAKQCIDMIDIDQYEVIIEPSAGNGSFLEFLPVTTLAYDIEPMDNRIICEDWFKVDKSFIKGKVLVIGNPPFGQQNSLAIKFFNESATIAETIAFILPLSFKKYSIQNKLNLNFHLQTEQILPVDSFILNEQNYSVPCVFQIWQKQDLKRNKKRLPTTCDFIKFVDKDNADIRIARVGGNAGKASIELDKAITSNYFIKNETQFTNIELINIINNIAFDSIEHTVGPKSLPKGELIEGLKNKLY